MKIKFILLPIVFLILSCSSNKAGFYYTTRANTTLYPGVRNPLEITPLGKAPVDISIKNGTLTKSEDNLYWIVVEPGKTSVIITFTQEGKTNEIYFRVQDFPSPVLSFRGKSYPDKVIALTEFREFRKIGGILPNFDYAISFQLVSCKIITITADGKQNYYNINNDNIPYSIVSGITAGSKIIFYDCKYKSDDNGYIFDGEDCVYTIR